MDSALIKIGIIDSGIGGLSVTKSIYDLQPNASVHYIADNKYLPYGEKPTKFIYNRVNYLANYLQKQGCKFIVLACHSASAQLHTRNLQFPWLGVVKPTINAIKKINHNAKIGVIGTNATINSGLYQSLDNVITLATPELANLIEQQTLNQTTVERIMLKLGKISHLALACTHYPLAEPMFSRANLDIIDTPKLCAKELTSIVGNIQGDGKCLIESTGANIFNIANDILGDKVYCDELSVL